MRKRMCKTVAMVLLMTSLLLVGCGQKENKTDANNKVERVTENATENTTEDIAETTKNVTLECEHSYTSTVTKEPTCEADGQGEVTYTCSICGDSYTEETDRIDHCTDDIKIVQEATCSQVGIKTYSCIFCGREFEREELPKLAHTESDWITTIEPTSTSKGSRHKVCTVCGEEVAVEEIEEIKEIVEVPTAPTNSAAYVIREYYELDEKSSITKYGSVITTYDNMCCRELSDGRTERVYSNTVVLVTDASGYNATDAQLLPETIEVTNANMALYQEAMKLANEFRVSSGVAEATLDVELCQRATMRVLEMYYADYWNEYRRADGRFCREFDCFPFIKNGEAMTTVGEDAAKAMAYFTRACPDNILKGKSLGFGYYGILWVVINY